MSRHTDEPDHYYNAAEVNADTLTRTDPEQDFLGAQVYATMAVAEELRKIRKLMETICHQGYLDVKTHDGGYY